VAHSKALLWLGVWIPDAGGSTMAVRRVGVGEWGAATHVESVNFHLLCCVVYAFWHPFYVIDKPFHGLLSTIKKLYQEYIKASEIHSHYWN
jgi:hypothetical protein